MIGFDPLTGTLERDRPADINIGKFAFDPLTGAIRWALGIVEAFSPLSLFAAGEQGAWYDPSDLTTLFQDSAGTTPVTAVEQPVGLMLDKSKGLVLGPELVTNGTFDTDTTGWTTYNGASLNVVSGVLNLYSSSSYGGIGAKQLLTGLTAGKTYKVSGTLSGAFGTVTPTVRWANGDVTIGYTNLFSGRPDGDFSGYFTPSSSTVSLFLINGGEGGPATFYYDNISVKEIAGNHASQPTSAARPVLSARYNLLTYTEQFDNAAWTKASVSVVTNQLIAPDGTTTVDFIKENTENAPHAVVQYSVAQAANVPLTFICSIAKYPQTNSREFAYATLLSGTNSVESRFVVNISLSSGTVTESKVGANWSNTSITIESNGNYWVVTMSGTPTTTGSTAWLFGASNSATPTWSAFNDVTYTGDGNSGIYIWGADLRVANDGVGIPSYQRVAAATDYDTAGFPVYLRFDGVDDCLYTSSIDFTATDKMTVWTGVRKLSDAAFGIMAELSAAAATTSGSFNLYVNTSATYGVALSGSSLIYANTSGTISVPSTNVLTEMLNIGAATKEDECALRVNTVLNSLTSWSGTTAGTGNFGNYPLYIGRRGNVSLPLNGRIYSMIVRGAESTETQISNTETWVNGKTKAY